MTFPRLILSASLLALSTGLAHAAPVAPTADAVLAANHAATGDLPAGTIEAAYAYAGQGMTGTLMLASDVATGAYAETYDLDAESFGDGFDGHTPWMRDLSAAYTAQEGGDRVELAVNAAYRNANAWWRPGRGGAEVAYAGREAFEGRDADHLVVTPRGGKRFDAWFDADTHLLAGIGEEQMFFKTRTLFTDYRREGATILAGTLTIDGGTGKDNYQILTLNRFRLAPPRPLASYARPTQAPTGAAIDGGKASVTVPFRLLNNHIYVQAEVNGKGPYTFIVDTGGHFIVSPRVVRELGLVSRGAAASAGAGEKVASNGYAQVAELNIGGVRMDDQTALTLQIYDPAVEGIPVDGMVGFELFRRFAVRLDYGAQTMTITDPARFKPPTDGGTAIPFKFYDHLPQVAGEVDGIPAKFDMDTGSRSEVDLTGPFVARHGLRERYAKGADAITGWGVGGPARSYVVRTPYLSLGPVRADSVVAALSTAKAGSFSDANYDGNIGSGYLKRFVVTFDYAHQTMYLKPLVPQPVDAGRFDRSGMWINAGPGGYSVTYVAEGGPAAEAGIAKDDVIVSIGGKRAVPAELSDARTLLRATPAGTRVAMEISRRGQRRTVEVTLRDQI